MVAGGGPVRTPTGAVTAAKSEHGEVSITPKNAAKGSTVMIKAVPKEGYALKTIAVTDQSGKPVAVTEKDGRFTFVMPACNVTLTPIFERQPAQNVNFDDVKPTEWYADAVRCVVEKGLMSGTGTDAFSPDGTTTRGMLMTILARYAGADTTGGASWYEKGMAWAQSAGISDGRAPEAGITREQLVTMLYLLCGCPRSRRHTGCLCRRRYRQLLRDRCYAMGGSERNRQRFARQTESTGECHPAHRSRQC